MGKQIIYPLYYYPDNVSLDQVRNKFLSYDLNILVQPYAATVYDSKRVLAIGDTPDWFVDYAYIEDVEDKHFLDAFLWAIYLKELDYGPSTVLYQLQQIFGEGVKQVADS